MYILSLVVLYHCPKTIKHILVSHTVAMGVFLYYHEHTQFCLF